MRVLVIDDEPNVRLGIKMLIPWEKEGFEIIGEGTDGIDGLNKIIELKPKLVLIDIRMPGLSGLEVIEEAKKRGFNGKFIITTGYSDFEYARKALRLGVSTYILKPIDEEELLEVVKKLKVDILEEEEKKLKLEASNLYLKKNIVTNLLMGKEITLDGKEYYIGLTGVMEKYYVGIVKINSKDYIEKLFLTFSDGLDGIINPEFIQLINDQIVIVLNDEEESVKILKRIQKRVKDETGIPTNIGLSSEIKNITMLGEGYQEASILLNSTFLYPEIDFFDKTILEQEAQKEDIQYCNPEWMGQKLCQLIQVEDKDKIESELLHFKQVLRRLNISKQKVASICSNMLLNLVQLLADTYSELAEKKPAGELIIEQIYECNHIDEIMNFMNKEIEKMLQKQKIVSPEQIMQKIIYYIDNNYNSDLKLEHLARLFNYNSGYLGKSFKNYTGSNFNTYLDQVRINQAKKLLVNGDMKVYEIAQKVGYKQMDYFYSKFKKYVGMSPLEFRKTTQ